MTTLTLVSALIAIVGLAFVLTSVRRAIQRRFFKAAGLGFSGLVFLLLALSSFLLASNLHTYQRLTFERPIAQVSFTQLNKQEYRAEIKVLDSGVSQSFDLKGDEWQMDTQVLTWRGMATLFGLDANYRLHRISGRYLDINEEINSPRSVYSLVKKPIFIENEDFDLWQFAHEYQDWMYWVDAAYGSAVFVPMTDRARYNVAISRTGLVTRPANKEARKAVSQWIGL